MNGRKKSRQMQLYIRFAEIFEIGRKCNVKMHHMESIFDSLVECIRMMNEAVRRLRDHWSSRNRRKAEKGEMALFCWTAKHLGKGSRQGSPGWI